MVAVRRPQLPAVTGYRGVAAIQVVAFHYYAAFLLTAPWWIRNFVSGAITSIDMFFIMSGFVLAYMYLTPGSGEGVLARRFYAARFARVYPLYALSLLLAAPLWMHGFLQKYPTSVMNGTEYLSSAVLMIQSWSPKAATVVNYPAWSLSVEAAFYVAFPVVVIPLTRLRRRSLLIAAGAIWLATLLAPTLYFILNPDGLGSAMPTEYGRWIRIVLYNPLIRMPEFLLGVVACLLFLGRRERSNERRWGARMSVLAALALVACLLATPLVPFAMMHNGLLAPLFAVLIYGLALGGGPVEWLLRRRWIVLLGEASFGIYILQDPLWMIAVTVGQAFTHTLGQDPWQWYWSNPWLRWIFAPMLVAFSIAVLYAYQEPARRWLNVRLGGARRQALDGVAALQGHAPSEPLPAPAAGDASRA